MKKLFVGVAMVLILGLVANVAFTDENVPFPFWQHGWNIMAFWSIVNNGTLDATITINMLNTDGTLHFSTTGTIGGGGAWQPATYEGWYTAGDGFGFGNYDMVASEDEIYLWGAVFSALADSSPGYTVVMPGNPYGM